MTAPRTLSAAPQPVRLYQGDNVLTGMARECVLLGRLAVEVVAFDGSVSSVMGEAVTGIDWLTDEEVRSLRARASGDAERERTRDAQMAIEGILSSVPRTRAQALHEYVDRAHAHFADGWAAMLAAEDIEEHGKDEHGSPLYRLSLPF